MNKFFVVFIVVLLCACAKSEGLQNIDNVENSTKASILDKPELSFAASHRDGLIYSEPEKLLITVDENLTNSEMAQEQALLVLKSLVQSQLDMKEEAFDNMTKAIQLQSDPEIYALRALVLWRGGKMRGAMRDAEYALLKQENMHLATMVQGLVLYSEQDMDAACQKLELACEAQNCFGLNFVQEEGECN